MSGTPRISSLDLDRFILDLEQNINNDDNTDFKKLTLFLFKFTNDKLISILEDDLDSDKPLLQRLISAVELVLSKRLHLLNSSLTEKDTQGIWNPQRGSLTSSVNDSGDTELLLYDWAIQFGLHHVAQFSHHEDILNQLKSFIMNLIGLVTTKLHNVRYIKLIRDQLLGLLDSNLRYLLSNLAELASQRFRSQLVQSVHLFTILNDLDVSNKLCLNLVNFQLKFESFGRKLWFVLAESSSMAQTEFQTGVDNLKAVLILNSTDNLVLNDLATWNQIALLLSWIVDYLNQLLSSASPPIPENFKLARTVSLSLMKIFKLSFEKKIHENFMKTINFTKILTKLTTIDDESSRSDSLQKSLEQSTSAISRLPPPILKSLHLIYYYYSLITEDKTVVNSYQTSTLNQFIIMPFDLYELDALRSKLLDLLNETDNKQISNMLFYLTDEKEEEPSKKKRRGNGKSAQQASDFSGDDFLLSNSNIDYSIWINHVHSVTLGSDSFTSSVNTFSLLSALGHFPCLLDNGFNFNTQECTKCGIGTTSKNPYDLVDPLRKKVLEKQETKVYYDIICNYFLGYRKRVEIVKNPVLCCNLLLAIYNLFSYYNTPERIKDDAVFNFIIEVLSKHSNREVRLSASRILPLYLIQPKSKQSDVNFKIIFKMISSIDFSSAGHIHFGESTVKAFVELAIISDGEWLCVLFIKLIDLLGEDNEQHVNYVYDGFLHIAAAKKLTPYKLLFPYLPSIAELIIKKDRIFSRVLELLTFSRETFLSKTKDYTTPRLLEYYKSDFIQEIADAANLSKQDLIFRNLPRIIAIYLVKEEKIVESYLIHVLSNIIPSYKRLTLFDLLTNVGETTWSILLEIQIDEEHDKFTNEKNILNALECVSKVSIKQKQAKNAEIVTGSDFNYIEYLLGEYILELVQRFSESVHHIKGTKPYLEKISSLRAIEFLINKHIKAVTTALGQISTCLQASLENSEFQYLALKCWHSLVHNLPAAHLISLMDIVISLIFQKFKSFESKSKTIAVAILKKIYEGFKGNSYSLYYLSIPFLDSIQDYRPIAGFKLSKQMSRLSIFQEFTRRLKTSNEYVVQQALQDLQNYCQEYQTNCQLEYFRDTSLEKVLSELLRTILDTSSKFKNKNQNISTNCAKVLSIVGSLDSNKFNYKSVKEQVIVIQDFGDYRENCEFLVDFIEAIVLKQFWAANNPIKQLFFAYAMQQFMDVLGLKDKAIASLSSSKESSLDSQEHLIAVWNKFSDVAKSTLTPLLTSRYFAPISKYEELEYPYFKTSMKFETWLADFTSDLFRRPLRTVFSKVPPKKEIIFDTCAKMIKEHDISLCHYLLKYAALSHIVNGNDDAIDDIKDEFLEILNTDFSTASPDRIESLKNCFQTVFEVLDYFHAWVSSATQYTNKSNLPSQEVNRINKNIRYVNEFLACIPMNLIALKSAECDSYERTILYIEKCYRGEHENKLEDSVIASTLQSMYANINDFDSLNGVLKKFSTNNLKEKLETFQYNENWSLAQESFQICGTDDIQKNTQLLKSLSDHGLYEEVLSNLSSKSNVSDLNSIPLDWAMVGLQASAQDGNYEQINKWLFIANSIGRPQDVETLVGYEFAKGIKFLFEKNTKGFQQCMENIYKTIGSSLVSSISSSFSRNTYLMNQLHAIYDFSLIIAPAEVKGDIRSRTNELILKARLENMDQGFDSQWKILNLHQVANKVMKNDKKRSELLLFGSSLARKNQRLDISTRSIVKAMVLNDQQANIEYANLLWAQGKQTEAIKSMKEIIEEFKFRGKEAKAHAQLQYAKWLDESNHLSSSAIINEYSKAIDLGSSWEKPYYDLGVYYIKIIESTKDQTGLYEQQTVRNFSKALAVGNSYIFEALPKLITIWLDFAQKRAKTRDAERKLNQMMEDLENCWRNIPMFVWYTAITQILSRIVHEHRPSFEKLCAILIEIIKVYPQHSLWYVLSHSNSNDEIRKERVNSILRKVKNESSHGVSIENARELFASLIKLAGHKISKSPRPKRMSLSKDFKITNLSVPYTSLVIPVRSNLEIRLPTIATSKFNAFPRSSSITFDGFDDGVNIFISLQMPRQVTIRGSDQKPYKLMVKRDDTRKDAKVVEFTTMINRLLLISTEARKRNLNIPNYYVVALAENMGVIEFVDDVQTMKSVVNEQKGKMGIGSNERKNFMKLDEAQKMVKSSKADRDLLDNLSSVYKKICDENPPVLHNWLIDQFADPSAWYLARNSFIRTSAVMSMVGYIIGLGDRHCENILFFKKSGSVLHIDFDCLFEKGATLPTPEIVPFRLTQNMVDAMGVCGIEGGFRITCEVTGSILRENEAPLMNILETLLYDPLLDWKSLHKPETHLSKVRRKIRGLVNEKEGLPMNIHGQVDVLIQEATSIERLSQMYGGWAPYL